jgi:hypothetical protein
MSNFLGKQRIGYEWKIPTGLGALILEGKPDPEELQRMKEMQDAKREVWRPGENAFELFDDLMGIIGREMVVQFWDKFMALLYDEGPYPVKVKISDVSIEKILFENKEFDQLFVCCEKYEILKVSYENLYYDPIDHFLFHDKNRFKFNVSDVHIIEVYENLNTVEKISDWRSEL